MTHNRKRSIPTTKRTGRTKKSGKRQPSSVASLPYELICSDALRALQRFSSNSVAAVITSPPYWSLRSSGIRGEIGSERLLSTYLNRLKSIFQELHRVIRNDGVLWLVIGDAYTSGNRRYRETDSRHPVRGMSSRPKTPKGLKPKDLIGLPWRIAFLLQEIGWHLRTEIIWHKPNAMPESVGDRPQRSHEYIFLLSKNSKYFFDRSVLDTRTSEEVDTQRSIWSVSVGSDGSGHNAVFPARLITPCLLSSTKRGDIVLDPFAGSGTVGVACIQNHRRFIGIELNTSYARLAKERLASMFKKHQTNGHADKWSKIMRADFISPVP